MISRRLPSSPAWQPTLWSLLFAVAHKTTHQHVHTVIELSAHVAQGTTAGARAPGLRETGARSARLREAGRHAARSFPLATPRPARRSTHALHYHASPFPPSTSLCKGVRWLCEKMLPTKLIVGTRTLSKISQTGSLRDVLDFNYEFMIDNYGHQCFRLFITFKVNLIFTGNVANWS